MKLSKNDQTVISVLRNRHLTHLIKPYLQLLELKKNGKITIHKLTFKSIMKVVYSDIPRKDVESFFLQLFVNFCIFYVKRNTKDPRESKQRVKKHRETKKALGYTQLSFLVSSPIQSKSMMATR